MMEISIGNSRATERNGVLLLGDRPYRHWAIILGRPHRRDFGEFIIRWAIAGCPPDTLLLSGCSDRPVEEFLQDRGIEWRETDSLTELRPRAQYSPSLSPRLPALGEEGTAATAAMDFGGLLLERDMEDFLRNHPNRLSEALDTDVQVASLLTQFSIDQGRPDIVASDKSGVVRTIECKRGPLHRSHVGQLMEYFRPEDPILASSQLVLLVNSANPAISEALRRADIEVCVYPYNRLVEAMKAEGYTPSPSTRKAHKSGSLPLTDDWPGITSWKAGFVSTLREVLPEEVQESLLYKADYADPKKLRLSRLKDDLPILYVASNGQKLELGLPVIHSLLISGVDLSIKKARAVYLSHTGLVPTITLEVKANKAAQWLTDRAAEFLRGIEEFESGLEPHVRESVLQHFGAVYQDSNPSKLIADGVCRLGKDCPYCVRDLPSSCST